MVHYLKPSVAIELALLCCSNITCKLLAPPARTQLLASREQRGSSPMVGQEELSWKSKNSNNWQYCQNLIFCTLYCLFLSVPPAVPQNTCSINTLQSNLLLVSYLPTRASVPPNAAALCTCSLLDSHIQAQCCKIWEAGGWRLWLLPCQPSLPIVFVSQQAVFIPLIKITLDSGLNADLNFTNWAFSTNKVGILLPFLPAVTELPAATHSW